MKRYLVILAFAGSALLFFAGGVVVFGVDNLAFAQILFAYVVVGGIAVTIGYRLGKAQGAAEEREHRRRESEN